MNRAMPGLIQFPKLVAIFQGAIFYDKFCGEHVERFNVFNGFSGGDFWQSRKLFVDSTTYFIDISTQFKSSSTQIDMLHVRAGKIPTRS